MVMANMGVWGLLRFVYMWLLYLLEFFSILDGNVDPRKKKNPKIPNKWGVCVGLHEIGS